MNTEISENKKGAIESLLEQGMKAELVAEEVGCSLRYVYIVKSGMGTTIKEPSTKDHITDIKQRIESMSEDVHRIAMAEEQFMILCPNCSGPFDFGYEESVVCQDCSILFCSEECIKQHKKKGFFDDESKCQEFKAKVSELIGDDKPAPEDSVGNEEAEPESVETPKVKESDKDDFW